MALIARLVRPLERRNLQNKLCNNTSVPARLRQHCFKQIAFPKVKGQRIRRSFRHTLRLGTTASASDQLRMNASDSKGEAVVSTASTKSAQDPATVRKALVLMSRPINLLPSILLVFLGAWAGTGRSTLSALRAILSSQVWVMSMLSGGVAVASVVVNDYFDYSSGVDKTNAPHKPLPRGVIQPDTVLLFSFLLYMAVLTAACLMEPKPIRMIVAVSSALTLLYTPLLKKWTGVKNFVVAAIISASPLAGAVAAGAGSSGVHVVLAPCLFAFLGIMYREILMDITDVEGDAGSGVWTLPVVLGREAALFIGGSIVVMASLYSLSVAMVGQGMAWLWLDKGIPEVAVRLLSAAASLGTTVPLLNACRKIAAAKYDNQLTGSMIDQSMKSIGLGMLLMALLA